MLNFFCLLAWAVDSWRFELHLSTAKARNFNTQQDLLRLLCNYERPTSNKNATIEWDDGAKIGNKNKLILTEIFPKVHET